MSEAIESCCSVALAKISEEYGIQNSARRTGNSQAGWPTLAAGSSGNAIEFAGAGLLKAGNRTSIVGARYCPLALWERVGRPGSRPASTRSFEVVSRGGRPHPDLLPEGEGAVLDPLF